MLIAGACWGDDGVKLTDGKSEVTGILPFNNPGPDYGYSAPVIGMNSERYIERIDTVWANKVPVYLSPDELKELKEMFKWWKGWKNMGEYDPGLLQLPMPIDTAFIRYDSGVLLW